MALTGPLSEELAAGSYPRAFMIEPGCDAPRAPFLFSDPIDPDHSDQALFARHFVDPSFSRFAPAPIHCAELGPASVCGIDGLIFKSGRIVKETTNLIYWRDVTGIASHVLDQSVSFRRDLRFFRKIMPGHYFVGTTATWPNFAHWMKECLPRLVLFLLLRMKRPGLKVILPPFASGSFHQATLDLLGIAEHDVYRIPPRCVVGFESLSAAFGIDMFAVSPMMAQVGWLMRAAHAARFPVAAVSRRRPIYLHRPSGVARRVENFDACRPVIEAAGFAIETFDGKPLHEQIACVRTASCLVAEHGAGLVNMLFCEPGTPVVELFSPATVQPAFWSLASRCGLPYGFMIGSLTDEAPDWNSDYRLDPTRLGAMLAQLGREHGAPASAAGSR